MIALQLKSSKAFMNALLVNSDFDSFLLEKALITTLTSIDIDGHFVEDYYTPDELEEIKKEGALPVFNTWKYIRPICFNLIKGRKLPVALKVTLQASDKMIDQIATSDDCNIERSNIRSLGLNIRFENGRVSCTTATTLTTFIPDKSVDKLWDKYIREGFTKLNLDYDEA